MVGHVLTAPDHDLMVLAYPHRVIPVEADAHDWFRQTQPRLKRWTRARWLALEQVKGGLENELVSFFEYDFRADKPISANSRAMKKLSCAMERGECAFTGHPDAIPDAWKVR